MWKRDGSGPRDIPGSFSGIVSAHFAGDGRKLAVFGRRPPAAAGIDVLDLPGLTRLEQIETPGEVLVAVRGDRLISVMPRIPNGSGADIVLRSFAGGDPRKLGSLAGGPRRLEIDASGDGYLIAFPGESQVLASTLNAGSVGQRPVLRTSSPVRSFWSARDGVRIVVLSDEGALHVESIAEARRPRRLVGPPLKHEDPVLAVSFDAIGRWVVAAIAQQGLQMWDMTGPPDAEPIRLRRGAVTVTTAAVFEPSGRWLAAEDLSGVALWPATQRWPSVLRVAANQPRDVAFDPGGKWIAAACRTGGVEIWPLTPDGPPRRVAREGCSGDDRWRFRRTASSSPQVRLSGSLLILPVSGSGSRELREFQGHCVRRLLSMQQESGSPPVRACRADEVRSFGSLSYRRGNHEGFRSGRRKGCRQCGLPPGWRPAHIKLWRIATRSMWKPDPPNGFSNNRAWRSSVPTAGTSCSSAPRIRTIPKGRLPCTTCGSDAPGRSRATAIGSRSWPGTLREPASSLAAETGSYGSVP